MPASTFALDVAGARLNVFRWLPEGRSRATMQIAHGMAEHAGRYARLAAALNAAGYAVYAHDHRGHGATASGAAELGFVSDDGGWSRLLDDMWRLNRRIVEEQPQRPVVLFGHSMGSFLAQDFMARHGESLAGVVLAGSSGKPPTLARLGRLLARLERLRLGRRGRSRLLHALAFEAFNKRFAPVRTPADWLSRDAAEVDLYCADPRCGFVSSVQLWIDLLDALAAISRPELHRRIPRGLPVLVMAGGDDPVSEGTRGLEQLIAAYRRSGLARVEHRFFPGSRHELFNDLDRDLATAELVGWLGRTLERNSGSRPG